ncbi:amino acid racemase [Candidatus Borrarchaeum sp.]|uniref:aspartate/glutamate racemase family protein n=1 Tax=Candidatus Borrarchaeum sp. TaxID=2846742 RepID=UPI0025804144|nr:amino acid racemase [Candidatus Borrarchaeum sp.]
MAKRIGILGGISYESTIKYYELILRTYYEQNMDYYYPEIVIFSLDFQKFTNFENENKRMYIKYILEGINSLEKAGAEFVLMAANSPHAVFEELEILSNIPLLSIVKVSAEKAKQEGMKKLLLLGIKFTMQSSFYQNACKKLGIEVKVPTEDEQNDINRIIFDELVIGVFKNESKNRLLEIISNYEVDGVILGCTELPLILKQKDADVKLLNTLKIHAEAALNYSLSS